MDFDQRDELWEATWKTYYDVYFQEILAERLVLRWQRFDEFSKIFVALTASGSAISGWTLWNNPEYKLTWVLIAGFGALLAIIHKSLDVSRKLTDWGATRSQFSALRIEIESFQNQIRFFPNFRLTNSVRL